MVGHNIPNGRSLCVNTGICTHGKLIHTHIPVNPAGLALLSLAVSQ